MNWDSIKEKVRQRELISVFQKPFMVVFALIIVAISFVNFSSERNIECPAILTYDEINQSIELVYCQINTNAFQIDARDKTGTIRADHIQFTIGDQTSVVPWTESSITVESLPDYVLINLIFSEACFQNNSPDVSFPVHSSGLIDCELGLVKEMPTSDDQQSLVQSDFEEQIDMEFDPIAGDGATEAEVNQQHLEKELKKTSIQKKKVEDRLIRPQSIKAKQEKLQYAVVNEDEEKRNTIVQTTKTNKSQEKRKLEKTSTGVTSVVVNSEDKKASLREMPVNQSEAKIVSTEVSSVIHDDNSSLVSVAKTEQAVRSSELSTRQIDSHEDIVSVPVETAPAVKHVNLFNTKKIGIEKACIEKSNKLAAKTDLFTISIKPNQRMTLYDIHCFASVNSEMTISLSKLGQVIKSFSVALNKGENQIGMSSLGMLEGNEAYLIECKTKNRGDVYLFSDCKASSNSTNEIVIRYFDNHTAFYGLTYEIEIE